MNTIYPAGVRIRALLLGTVLFLGGCAAGSMETYRDRLPRGPESPEAVLTGGPGEAATPSMLPEEGSLQPEELVRAVLGRNPDIATARAAWRAALEQYPSAVSLDDPSLSLAVAPASVGAPDLRLGTQLQLAQRLPWPGRLRLAGEQVLARADALEGDLEAVRQRLALAALTLYYDWYALERSLEINREHQRLLEEIRESAAARYASGQASPQDPLEARLELAALRKEHTRLSRSRDVVRAGLTELLALSPGDPIPFPPSSLPPPSGRHTIETGPVDSALQRRPELIAAQDRVRAADLGVDLARLQYYPDVGIMAAYNSLMAMPEYRTLVGISIQVPIQLERRRAGERRAESERTRAQRVHESLELEIQREVQQALLRRTEAGEVLEHYRSELLPTAREQLEAARNGFTTGRNDFAPVIRAEKNLRTLELEYQMALAEVYRRGAELERAMGRIPGLAAQERQR